MVPGLVEEVPFAVQPDRRLDSAVPSPDLVAGDICRTARMDRGVRLFRRLLRWEMCEEADRHILMGQLSR